MQQVNLYLPIFRREQKIFSVATMLKIFAIFISALMLIFFTGLWQQAQLQTQLQSLQSQLKETQQRLAKMKKDNPVSPTARLEQELQSLRKDVERRRLLRNSIESQRLGNATGFSAYLRTLSEEHVAGISIQQFALREGGQVLEMEGWARDADAVPLYLERLQAGDAFAGSRFGILSVARDDERSDALLFSLSRPKKEMEAKLAGKGQ